MVDETMSATVTVERLDEWCDIDEHPINAQIQNPFDFPMEQYEYVNEIVRENYSTDDLADGEKRVAGEVVYTEDKVVHVRV
jgi:hypothetical protein